ncbi:dicarboxylate/amino acid:cation symporter [Corynebacterium sp. 153RC1]|uniref:dicarboxylate/amino acid:cation symporter n=1 Tax=unclassified Corynebacterium TaxID=2624378 RepID=UPI00211B7FC4|nr:MULTISPECIES: dicarboxylate/amino acid:cation symporter [unclassified Corynebacterium]MCQ9352783.1 dicarboxylate/amino acid:cation symporter [Corynebacterium sp. 209RC1]MCQ9354967.1 dicarboxylate/amino acid:cation symporter [Corynebacterium sp. 1222RC1]MCQ9357228.1 dicarboxylate/amino acid:cation symporter [Corynebacterium sp. 122RC1]MCQ9359403.1 dicarboxylate/amino acid:cation symporter [Corynebacterium sp. 142RC1]MCQ9361625.1 dicarboxylate/amino acid:cation symporter [Corynebacterium sp. 
MDFKRLSSSLLFRIIVAIILGIICSFFFPVALGRVFVTFNSLFGNFLGFFIPVLIFALITPAIAGLGRGAGKWLAITTGIAYGSAVIAGIISWAVATGLYPILLAGQQNVEVADIDGGALQPFITIEMPAPMPVMTALILAFVIGVAMTVVKSDTLFAGVADLRRVVMKVISGFVVPLLPIYIFGMFLSLGMNGNLVSTLTAFAKVLVLAIVLSFLLLIAQFTISGAIARKNPFTSLKNMMPAYFTALGTSSSAATIPVTYECARRNGVSQSVAGFVVPLCATIHLSGSMMKITLFAFAIMFMDGMDLSFGKALGFLLMLGVTMVAAPGVPGGAIMAAVGLLTASLGFNDDQIALMIAAYIAIDSFGTACNVTGDGAIAQVVDRWAKGNIERSALDEEDDLGLASAIEGIEKKELEAERNLS